MIIGQFPDAHAPAMKKGYPEFVHRTFHQWGVDRVIFTGDLFDWNSISFHEKNPLLSNSGQELRDARKQIQEIKKLFPEADWIIGNHDALPQRQAVAAGLAPGLLKTYNELWEVDWKVHPRFTKLEVDGVLYCHGDSGPGGEHAAYKHAVSNFKSTVQGHHHSNAGVKYFANEKFRVFGMDGGCGVDVNKLQFEYGRKFPRKPILGCGIVVDGKAGYFEPWLLKSR